MENNNEIRMTVQEAYAAVSATARPNQTIFISTDCGWYYQMGLPGREFTAEFKVSVVPGFDSECDQWRSGTLRSAVDLYLEDAKLHAEPFNAEVEGVFAEASQ